MTYAVKEIFYTLQGEGANAGRPAVFCRFAGCNLWSGREADRAQAVCRFCDTEFVGTDGSDGGKFQTAADLALRIERQWPTADRTHRFVVLTGGEPLLQVDGDLLAALHHARFEIAVETNGTVLPPPGIDWVCVSPKAGSDWILRRGNELKLVWPQPDFDLGELAALPFEHRYLQPMDNARRSSNTAACIEACLRLPAWKLSTQMHKMVGLR